MAGVLLSSGSCISELAAWDYGVFWRMGWDRGGEAKGTNEGEARSHGLYTPNSPRLSVGDTTAGLVPQTITFPRAEIRVK